MTQTQTNGSSFSIYIHIPFCKKKCDYCSFYVVPYKERLVEDYFLALLKELKKEISKIQGNRPLTLYFGGGTPSLLPIKNFQSILEFLNLPSNTEITLEVNPEDSSLEKFQQWKKLGFNRISLGIQTFSPKLLKKLSRTHSIKNIYDSIDHCMQVGINNISGDLMYDLPGQTLEDWEKSLKIISSLPFTHISIYNLTLEPHTVFYKYKEKIIKEQPKQSSNLLMTKLIPKILSKKGFKRYEIASFSLPNYESIHNKGYWLGRPFLGVGVSASSYFWGIRKKNISNILKYIKNINADTSIEEYSETLPSYEKKKELLCLGLRFISGIDLQKSCLSDFKPKLIFLEKQGFIEIINNIVKLSSLGLLFHNTVCEEIMNL